MDYKLINELTEKRSDLNFVFIGIDYNSGLSQLKQRDNVKFLGPKAYETLPNYSYYFDCAIIPFKEGDIAKSTSPVKLFEYMAMGVPTVCTKDLNECRGYEYVYMSENAQNFEVNIDKAIKNKKELEVRKKLIEQARRNDWKARVDDIYKELVNIENKR